ncbi:MAG: PLDc N-terminal domain-containing protein [Chloroflexota bacterium]
MPARLILLLVPLVALQLYLQVAALRDVARQPRVMGNNKWLWVAIIVLGGLLGPLIYYAVGRKEG